MAHEQIIPFNDFDITLYSRIFSGPPPKCIKMESHCAWGYCYSIESRAGKDRLIDRLVTGRNDIGFKVLDRLCPRCGRRALMEVVESEAQSRRS